MKVDQLIKAGGSEQPTRKGSRFNLHGDKESEQKHKEMGGNCAAAYFVFVHVCVRCQSDKAQA